MKGKLKDEHLPAMHSALGWNSHLFIRHMVKFAPHRFQGIAGRSNIERPTFDVGRSMFISFSFDLTGRSRPAATLNREPRNPERYKNI